MPLLIQIKKGATWVDLATLKPGDNPGSISDNLPEKRELYVFKCSGDDLYSVLLRSKQGIDVESQSARVILSKDFETVRTLRKGDTHDLGVVAQDGTLKLLRFKHE